MFEGLTHEPDQVLAVLAPSTARRVFGAGVLALLGVVIIWVAATMPLAGWVRVLLLVPAVLAALGAVCLWQASASRIELTQNVLRNEKGVILARIPDITRVDRGVFAFKPSNGFLVRLNAPQPRAWAPGLWWRVGGLLGVGGVTSAHDTKVMAETLIVLMSQRSEQDIS